MLCVHLNHKACDWSPVGPIEFQIHYNSPYPIPEEALSSNVAASL